MASIEWCKNQNKGIRFTKPNSVIANDYIRKADEALNVLQVSPSKEWKAVSAYYACYDALYALLQKAGIICEIHDCSIALMYFFGFTQEEMKFMEDLKTQRTNAQYYTDRSFYVAEINKIKEFVLNCKNKLQTLDLEKIKNKIEKL